MRLYTPMEELSKEHRLRIDVVSQKNDGIISEITKRMRVLGFYEDVKIIYYITPLYQFRIKVTFRDTVIRLDTESKPPEVRMVDYILQQLLEFKFMIKVNTP